VCGEKAPVRAKVQHEINNIENLPQGIEFRVTRWRNIQKEIMLYVSGEQPECHQQVKWNLEVSLGERLEQHWIDPKAIMSVDLSYLIQRP